MIAIDDKDVPPEPALLTLAEFNEGCESGLYAAARGDAIIEWYAQSPGGGPLLGRMWLWLDGLPTPLRPAGFNLDTLRVLVLWYAKPERMH